MNRIPQSPKNATPPVTDSNTLVCKKCGAIVPANKLICDCFAVDAEREARARKLEAFHQGVAHMYLLTGSPERTARHILPALGHCLSLCEQRRYKRKPETRTISRADNLKDLEACEKCIWVLERARK